MVLEETIWRSTKEGLMGTNVQYLGLGLLLMGGRSQKSVQSSGARAILRGER